MFPLFDLRRGYNHSFVSFQGLFSCHIGLLRLTSSVITESVSLEDYFFFSFFFPPADGGKKKEKA